MGLLDVGSPQQGIFLDLIAGRLYAHHAFYDESRVSNDLWEETLSRVLHSLDVPHDWKRGSHEVGTDISLLGPDGERQTTISVKSGVYSKAAGTLVFSGSRLGNFAPDMHAMHRHILTTQSDYYIFAAHPPPPTKKRGGGTPWEAETHYSIFIIPKSQVDYGRAEDWVVKKKPEYQGPGLHADIRPSMSHQLWTTLHLERPYGASIEPLLELSIAKQYRPRGLAG